MGGKQSKAALPNLKGKLFVVTGANSGIGYMAAKALGQAEATVVVCARSKTKGDEAVEKLKGEAPEGSFELGLIDLSDLKSVRSFVDGLTASNRGVDVLINNAGVMNPPKRELTADGFELQVGTNFLGHYALSILMLPLLRKTKEPRIVNVASIAAREYVDPMVANPDWEPDFVNSDEAYRSYTVYCESKLLNLILNNAMAAKCPDVKSIACHPGVCATNLFRYKFGWLTPVMQSAESGALSELHAALHPDAISGKSYYGPAGWYGGPTELTQPAAGLNETLQAKYWAAAVKATGIDI